MEEPETMTDLFVIRIQQNMEELNNFAFDDRYVFNDLHISLARKVENSPEAAKGPFQTGL